jgi:hypothetical protein
LLLTAAHVASAGTWHGFGLYVPSGVQGTPLIPLGETTAYTSEKEDPTDDVVDVAAVHLLPHTVPSIVKGIRFIRLQHLDHRDPGSPESAYVVFGYPHAQMRYSKERSAVGTAPLPYQSMICDGRKGFPPNFDPTKHLLLDFQLSDNKTNSGEPVSVPDPNGMSGCGICRMFRFDRGMLSWTTDEIRLVGIQHGWWKSCEVRKRRNEPTPS